MRGPPSYNSRQYLNEGDERRERLEHGHSDLVVHEAEVHVHDCVYEVVHGDEPQPVAALVHVAVPAEGQHGRVVVPGG